MKRSTEPQIFSCLWYKKGDHVALHLDNCPEFFFCWFGLAKIGAVMVPINARFMYEESAWIINHCQAHFVVTSDNFSPIYQPMLHDKHSPLTQLFLITENGLPTEKGVVDFLSEKAKHPVTLNHHTPLSVDDTAEILFTSGTTSQPKGVVITHYNLRFAGYYSSWQNALREDDIYLTVMPAFHIDCQCTASLPAFLSVPHLYYWKNTVREPSGSKFSNTKQR